MASQGESQDWSPAPRSYDPGALFLCAVREPAAQTCFGVEHAHTQSVARKVHARLTAFLWPSNARAPHPTAGWRLTCKAGTSTLGQRATCSRPADTAVRSTRRCLGASAVPSRAFLGPPLLQQPFLEAPGHRLGSPVPRGSWPPLLPSALRRHSVQRERGLLSGCLGVKWGSTTVSLETPGKPCHLCGPQSLISKTGIIYLPCQIVLNMCIFDHRVKILYHSGGIFIIKTPTVCQPPLQALRLYYL